MNWIAINQRSKLRIVFLLFGSVFVSWAIPAHANDGPNNRPQPQYLTGKQLDKALELAVSVDWRQSRLRDGLLAFGQRQKVAIVVDRRLDPGILIDLRMLNVTAEQFLWNVAEKQGGSVCRIGDVFVFGAAESANQLPAVIEASKKQLEKIPDDKRRIWRSKAKLGWPYLSEPRQLLKSLAEQHGLTITNLEKIPHDLLPAYDLPAMTLHERFGVLCSVFGCWMKIQKDGKTLTLIDQPVLKTGTRKFKVVAGDAKAIFRKIKTNLPDDCKVSLTGNTLEFSGGPNGVATVLKEVVLALQPKIAPLSDQRLSLNLQGKGVSRKVVLKQVAMHIERELVLENENMPGLQDDCEIKLENETVEEVLRQILAGSPLNFRIDGGKLIISEQ